jgi:hypothetical protein
MHLHRSGVLVAIWSRIVARGWRFPVAPTVEMAEFRAYFGSETIRDWPATSPDRQARKPGFPPFPAALM